MDIHWKARHLNTKTISECCTLHYSTLEMQIDHNIVETTAVSASNKEAGPTNQWSFRSFCWFCTALAKIAVLGHLSAKLYWRVQLQVSSTYACN